MHSETSLILTLTPLGTSKLKHPWILSYEVYLLFDEFKGILHRFKLLLNSKKCHCGLD